MGIDPLYVSFKSAFKNYSEFQEDLVALARWTNHNKFLQSSEEITKFINEVRYFSNSLENFDAGCFKALFRALSWLIGKALVTKYDGIDAYMTKLKDTKNSLEEFEGKDFFRVNNSISRMMPLLYFGSLKDVGKYLEDLAILVNEYNFVLKELTSKSTDWWNINSSYEDHVAKASKVIQSEMYTRIENTPDVKDSDFEKLDPAIADIKMAGDQVQAPGSSNRVQNEEGVTEYKKLLETAKQLNSKEEVLEGEFKFIKIQDEVIRFYNLHERKKINLQMKSLLLEMGTNLDSFPSSYSSWKDQSRAIIQEKLLLREEKHQLLLTKYDILIQKELGLLSRQQLNSQEVLKTRLLLVSFFEDLEFKYSELAINSKSDMNSLLKAHKQLSKQFSKLKEETGEFISTETRLENNFRIIDENDNEKRTANLEERKVLNLKIKVAIFQALSGIKLFEDSCLISEKLNHVDEFTKTFPAWKEANVKSILEIAELRKDKVQNLTKQTRKLAREKKKSRHTMMEMIEEVNESMHFNALEESTLNHTGNDEKSFIHQTPLTESLMVSQISNRSTSTAKTANTLPKTLPQKYQVNQNKKTASLFSEKRQFIDSVSFFGKNLNSLNKVDSLTSQQKDLVAEALAYSVIGRGHVIAQEGDLADTLYFVMDVRITICLKIRELSRFFKIVLKLESILREIISERR